MASHPSLTLALLTLSLCVIFVRKLFKERRRYAGLPGPPHHWLWGHIPIFLKLTPKIPRKLAFLSAQVALAREYNLGPIYYLDLWPLTPGFCVVQDGDMAAQVTQTRSLPKWSLLVRFVSGFTGPESIAVTENPRWKFWRHVFNPGFSVARLTQVVPKFVRHGEVFVQQLQRRAESGEVFSLEPMTTRLTIDVITDVIMDNPIDAQRTDSELLDVMMSIPKFLSPPGSRSFFRRWSPVRIITYQYYNAKINRILGQMFDQQLAARRSGESGRERNALSIALEAYEGQLEKSAAHRPSSLADFRRNAVGNLRGFLFAGYDTTSNTLCMIYNQLHRYPNVLARVREEHNDVFGQNVSGAAAVISENPNILSKMKYTTAVINETLRLWPLVGTARIGQEGVDIIDRKTGASYPTYRGGAFGIQIGSLGVHRWSGNFKEPDVFDPDRFMPGQVEKMSPNAFRPFERGPRHCIGMDMAYMELKVMLALTVRLFDLEVAYSSAEPTFLGERAYPVLMITSKPADGLPIRVRRRGPES